METRAPYALIGLFVLAAIGAVFGFVYWLHNTGGLGERAVYRVRFENTGVRTADRAPPCCSTAFASAKSPNFSFDRQAKQVLATIAVAAGTPVRADTQAGTRFPGPDRRSGRHARGRHRSAATTMRAAAHAGRRSCRGQSMTQAARDALGAVDTLLAENSIRCATPSPISRRFRPRWRATPIASMAFCRRGADDRRRRRGRRRRSTILTAPPHSRRSRSLVRAARCRRADRDASGSTPSASLSRRKRATARALPMRNGATAFRNWCRRDWCRPSRISACSAR